jgi:hypothetical protein
MMAGSLELDLDDPAEDDWECDRCGCFNPPYMNKCQACDSPGGGD